MKKLAALLFACAALYISAPAHAQQQQKEPPMPAPIKTLAEQGAQVRYLGRHDSLDGWITIKNGQEQYFYATEDGKSLLMGLLFDTSGKLVTLRQVKTLQENSDGKVLDMFTVETPEAKTGDIPDRYKQATMPQFKTPAEQLFDDVSSSNWIRLGRENAPVIYSFMDPNCPHCHSFMTDLKTAYLDKGLVQVRLVPVGFLKPESKEEAAFLLAAPDPEQRWYRHMSGDKTALPAEKGINEQGVERNMAIMQSWKLDATPITIYRAKDGQVKIVQGRPQKMSDILGDLPAKAQ